MTIETPRLLISPVGRNDDPEEFLAVFNSNPEYLEEAEGRRVWSRSDVERYLGAESGREHGRCLAIRLREDGSLIGAAALLVPHPDGCPWIGLLIVRGDRRRRGLGSEVALALEAALALEGWEEVRLGVLKASEEALRFWRHGGYRVLEETEDSHARPVWVLAKPLGSGAGAG